MRTKSSERFRGRLRANMIVCILWATLPTWAGPPAKPVPAARPLPASPYLRPELATLMDAVTFHMSFDNNSMAPDMAAAASGWEPRVSGSYTDKDARPEYATGLIGTALVLGTGVAVLTPKGNVDLAHQGAIALWVKPLEWNRPNGSNCTFVMSSRCMFYLQRQGPAVGKDNKILRHEHIQFLAKASKNDKRFTGLTGGVWKNHKWYFVAASWSWPNMTLSIDGSPLRTKALRGTPEDNLFGDIVIGARGGDRALLDEVLFFKRPLSFEETRLLHNALRPPGE